MSFRGDSPRRYPDEESASLKRGFQDWAASFGVWATAGATGVVVVTAGSAAWIAVTCAAESVWKLCNWVTTASIAGLSPGGTCCRQCHDDLLDRRVFPLQLRRQGCYRCLQCLYAVCHDSFLLS